MTLHSFVKIPLLGASLCFLSSCYELSKPVEVSVDREQASEVSGGYSQTDLPVDSEQPPSNSNLNQAGVIVLNPRVSLLNVTNQCISSNLQFDLRLEIRDDNSDLLKVAAYRTRLWLDYPGAPSLIRVLELNKNDGAVRALERDKVQIFSVYPSDLRKVKADKLRLYVEVEGYLPAVTKVYSDWICLDSEAPEFLNPKLDSPSGVALGKDRILFFTGEIKDKVSGVNGVCALPLASGQPSLLNPCWVPVVSGANNLATAPYYIGDHERFTAMDLRFWVKDRAGNVGPACRESGASCDQVVHRLDSNLSGRAFGVWDSCFEDGAGPACASLSFLSSSGPGTVTDLKVGVFPDEAYAQPGRMVVTKAGKAFVVDPGRGVLEFDLNLRVARVLVSAGASSPPENPATVSGGQPELQLQEPQRIALDSSDRLWIRDSQRLVVVDAKNSSWEVIEVNGAPLVLNDSADIRRYGSFAVSGKGEVIFSNISPLSDELDPISGNMRPARRLSIYVHDDVDPSKRRLEGIRLRDLAALGDKVPDRLASLYPIGPMGILADSVSGKATDIVGAFCRLPAEGVDPRKCDPSSIGFYRFDRSGSLIQVSRAKLSAPVVAGNFVMSAMHGRLHWWNTPIQRFASVPFPEIGSSSRSQLSSYFDQILDLDTSADVSLLSNPPIFLSSGGNSAGYCNRNSHAELAEACVTRAIDYYPGSQGQVYFLEKHAIANQYRIGVFDLVDDRWRVRTLFLSEGI